MRIFSESSYKEHIKMIRENAWMLAWKEGFDVGQKRVEEDPYDRDYRAGRITLNEYRMLKYHLPRIERNKGEEK